MVSLPLLYAEDQIIIKDSENKLQATLYKLGEISNTFLKALQKRKEVKRLFSIDTKILLYNLIDKLITISYAQILFIQL